MRRRPHEANLRLRHTGRLEDGQTLVEFAMVIPIVIVFLMGVIEFALAMGATLGVNRASQNAAHIAASAGNITGADCLILRRIESDIGVPNDPARIIEVIISRQSMAGNLAYEQQTWRRSGATDCPMPDGSTLTLPYTLTQNGYPESQRCVVLAGCPLLAPARSTVDNIGVSVRYRHAWITPLEGALGLIADGGLGGSGGWTFEQRNIFRMEPHL